MKKDSILFSITNFFLITTISIIAFFTILIYLDQKKEDELQNSKIYRAIKTLRIFERNRYSLESLNEQLKTLELHLEQINMLGDLLPYKTINDRVYIELYEIKGKKYIKAIIPRNNIYLFRDLQKEKIDIPYLVFGLFAAVFFTFLSYIAIIKKLKPLKYLEQNVVKFGQGDLNISTKTSGDDEISRLSNSFHSAITNIKRLKDSRDFFIRNIMHELKTPITKGKITIELLEDDKNRTRLTNVFERLEILINELASVESIISGVNFNDKRDYRIADIIDCAKDLMLDGQADIRLENIDRTICVDYEMFCIAFKNLIDNGIKHSADKSIEIRVNNNNLEFINRGKEMKKTLEEQTKPFEKTKSDGFGLGLYIVDTILTSHDYKIQYRYEEGKSIFFFAI